MSRDHAIAFGALILSAVMTWLVLKLALRFQLIDHPSSRSSHSLPTPRGGGVAIVLAFLAALFMLRFADDEDLRLANALIFGGAAVAIVGMIDDRWSLRPRNRLLVHLAAAAFAVWRIGMPASWQLDAPMSWVVAMIGLIAITWGANLFNFMDGIDGLAALEVVFMAGGAVVINTVIHGDAGITAVWLALAASSMGFLVWNWPPARIFMGDVGSGFLGFALTACTLAMSRHQPANIPVVVILGGVFFVDASVTVIRRILRGDRWLEPHRLHAYQHLARRWQSHRRVTVGVGVINVVWLLPCAFVAATHPSMAVTCAIVALLPLVLLAAAAGAGRPERSPDLKIGST
jgi:Fuc2NAc and GlcNAc transferase